MHNYFAQAAEAQLMRIAPILDDAMLVGGVAVGLIVDELGAPPPRPTNDIDLVVAIDTRVAYESIADRLRELGLAEDSTSSVICRWRHATSGDVFDVMPTSQNVFGFGNEWYAPAFEACRRLVLPSGLTVHCASSPYLLAMKFVAWEDRGKSDPMASHDMNDIVAIIDGVAEVVSEVAVADAAVKQWLAGRFVNLAASGLRDDALLGYMRPDPASQSRRPIIVDRMDQIAAMQH